VYRETWLYLPKGFREEADTKKVDSSRLTFLTLLDIDTGLRSQCHCDVTRSERQGHGLYKLQLKLARAG